MNVYSNTFTVPYFFKFCKLSANIPDVVFVNENSLFLFILGVESACGCSLQKLLLS